MENQTDSGASADRVWRWESLAGAPGEGTIVAVQVDHFLVTRIPQSPSTVYVTTAPTIGIIGGPFNTADGGAKWTRMSNGLLTRSFGGGGGEASNRYQARHRSAGSADPLRCSRTNQASWRWPTGPTTTEA